MNFYFTRQVAQHLELSTGFILHGLRVILFFSHTLELWSLFYTPSNHPFSLAWGDTLVERLLSVLLLDCWKKILGDPYRSFMYPHFLRGSKFIRGYLTSHCSNISCSNFKLIRPGSLIIMIISISELVMCFRVVPWESFTLSCSSLMPNSQMFIPIWSSLLYYGILLLLL